MDVRSAELLARWRGGDQGAAGELVRRYSGRLLALAQSRLDSRSAGEPSPADAAALTDTVGRLLRGLDPLQRRMVRLRLEGYRLDEIAATVRRSERTVRRLLEQVRWRLEEECGEGPRP